MNIDLLHSPILMLWAAAALLLVPLVVAFADSGRGKIHKRVDRLRNRSQVTAITAELILKRDFGNGKALDRLAHRLMPKPDLLRARLRRTGRSIGIGTYSLTCIGVAVASGFGATLFGFSAFVAVPIGLLFGLWFPHIVIGWLGKRRAMRFTMLFPEAIGLMVRSIKSGLPITEAFVIVGREIRDPVGLEFRHLCDQIRLGQPIDQVLWDTARRVATPEMKFLVVTLSVQRETGGNLAETLENLDNILRRRRQMKLKIKAMSSEARASAMIIGALPFLMMLILWVVDHDYLILLFTRHLGHILLGGAAASLLFGVGVMAKMVKFNI